MIKNKEMFFLWGEGGIYQNEIILDWTVVCRQFGSVLFLFKLNCCQVFHNSL